MWYITKEDYIAHYGVGHLNGGNSGRYPWGSGERPYQRIPSSKNLSKQMKKFTYDSTNHGLKSVEEVEKTKSGNCHDQVLYELSKLKEMGYKPKAKFLIEVDPKTGQGGMTHSFVYYKDKGKTIWFENAWEDKAGIKEFDSLNDIKKYFQDSHNNGDFGDKSNYSKIYWGDFNPNLLKPGDSLQDIVNKCLK